MCSFFSLVSDGHGKIMYPDWEFRQKCLSGELKYETDSHTSIADYNGYRGKKEDNLNKYEYNPLTKEFVIDQINTVDDSKEVELFCNNLDFKTIIPQLIIKPIVHPFKIPANDVTQADIDNLHKWASVWDSVRASVGASVWGSVGGSVWASVWGSVRDSVWDSVGASVWGSVGDSVGASVGAYISSFFDIEYKYDFTPCVALWERGFVPSYDGKTWRLHNSKGIVYEEVKEGK